MSEETVPATDAAGDAAPASAAKQDPAPAKSGTTKSQSSKTRSSKSRSAKKAPPAESRSRANSKTTSKSPKDAPKDDSAQSTATESGETTNGSKKAATAKTTTSKPRKTKAAAASPSRSARKTAADKTSTDTTGPATKPSKKSQPKTTKSAKDAAPSDTAPPPSPAAAAAAPTTAPAAGPSGTAAREAKRYVAHDIPIARTVTDLRARIAALRTTPETTVALVPTMGALHEGHLALIDKAADTADRVVVSIFVNPKQFAPTEDLATYPRCESADLRQIKRKAVSLAWIPTPEVMYPNGFATRIIPGGPALELETDHRPHFFEGVATVVTKLLTQVRPDYAVFGEKDYQQLCVIRRLTADLDLGVEIVAGETVREKDGLALSSRNAYLSKKEREIAPALARTIRKVAEDVRTGRPIPVIRAEAMMHLLSDGFRRVDYIEVRDAETLGAYDPASGRPGRVLAAAWLGSTRLIDNVPV